MHLYLCTQHWCIFACTSILLCIKTQEWCFFACLSNILLCIKCSRTQLLLVYPNANAYALNCSRTYPFLAHPTLLHLFWHTSYASNTRAFMSWGCLPLQRLGNQRPNNAHRAGLALIRAFLHLFEKNKLAGGDALTTVLFYMSKPGKLLESCASTNMVNNINIVQVSPNHL